MTELSQRDDASSTKPAVAKRNKQQAIERRDLTYKDTYLCPVCRHGQIAPLTLMDAFACDFCRHIFTGNLQEQSIHVEDSSQPMTWRWNGHNWKSANQMDVDLTIVVWLVGVALVLLPPALIWLSSHTFPPLHGSTWAWFPAVWISLTFGAHFAFVSWLLAEHYQVPIYITYKIRLRDALGRR